MTATFESFEGISLKFDNGLETEVVTISTSEAGEWLDTYRGPNRIINKRKVGLYRSDMENGRWMFDASPIRISSDGKLLDGQHRLKALATCGENISLPFLVVRGLDPESQMVMDQPQVRTTGQQLQLKGLTNSALIGAVAKQYLDWTRGRLFRSLTRNGTTKAEIIEWVLNNRELLARVMETRFNRIDGLPSAVGAFTVAAIQADPDRCHEFLDKLSSCVGLEEGSPILALDRRLRNIRRNGLRVSAREVLGMFIKAWNMWLNGETCTKLVLPHNLNDENFPVLLAPKPVKVL